MVQDAEGLREIGLEQPGPSACHRFKGLLQLGQLQAQRGLLAHDHYVLEIVELNWEPRNLDAQLLAHGVDQALQAGLELGQFDGEIRIFR